MNPPTLSFSAGQTVDPRLNQFWEPFTKPDEGELEHYRDWVAVFPEEQEILHSDGEPLHPKITHKLLTFFGLTKCDFSYFVMFQLFLTKMKMIFEENDLDHCGFISLRNTFLTVYGAGFHSICLEEVVSLFKQFSSSEKGLAWLDLLDLIVTLATTSPKAAESTGSPGTKDGFRPGLKPHIHPISRSATQPVLRMSDGPSRSRAKEISSGSDHSSPRQHNQPNPQNPPADFGQMLNKLFDASEKPTRASQTLNIVVQDQAEPSKPNSMPRRAPVPNPTPVESTPQSESHPTISEDVTCFQEFVDASWNGLSNTVRSLLASRSAAACATLVNMTNSRGQTPLYCAASRANIEVMILLLNTRGINIDKAVQDHGGTPLHVASYSGHAEAVALLVAKGANQNVINNAKLTPKQEARGESLLFDLYNHSPEDKNWVREMLSYFPRLARLEDCPPWTGIYKVKIPLVLSWKISDTIVLGLEKNSFANCSTRRLRGKAFDEMVLFFETTMFGKGLKFSEILFCYNPDLSLRFNIQRKIHLNRFEKAANIFYNEKWRKAGDQQKLGWVYDHYLKRVSTFPWNADSSVKILPVLYGCSLKTAKSICSTGFSAISLLDEGWYGQGMYFTENAKYTIPFLKDEQSPVILLCFVIMGNTCPVANLDLKGKPIGNGYQSHYVVTDLKGKISPSNTNCTEVVVSQESQVLPAYIFSVNTKDISFSAIVRQWDRELPKKNDNKDSEAIKDFLAAQERERELEREELASLNLTQEEPESNAIKENVEYDPESLLGFQDQDNVVDEAIEPEVKDNKPHRPSMSLNSTLNARESQDSVVEEQKKIVTLLCEAAWRGDDSILKGCLSLSLAREMVNHTNTRGQTPLYCAASQGHAELVLQLINVEGIDIHYPVGAHGSTALHVAGYEGRLEVVALLLAKGASMTIPNTRGANAKEEARVKELNLMNNWNPDDRTWLSSIVAQFPRLLKVNCRPWNTISLDTNSQKPPLQFTWKMPETKLLAMKKKGAYYSKRLQGKSLEKFAAYFETNFYGKGLKISNVEQIYNPTLVSGFNLQRKILSKRLEEDAASFYQESWRGAVGEMQRAWVIEQYKKKVADFPWNNDSDLKILPVLHGTSAEVARGIASNGFASLASLDEGWFGRGMYFTTNGKYTIPYIITKNPPTIILCFVLMGNPYPVISTEVRGKSLQAGFHSHYVVTNPAGKISTVPFDCDEVVIEQESQILPAYIIEIDKGKDFYDLTGKWLRDVRKKTYVDGNASHEAAVDSVQEMSQHEEWAKQAQNFLESLSEKDLVYREESKRRREQEESDKTKKALNSFYEAQNKERTAMMRFTLEDDPTNSNIGGELDSVDDFRPKVLQKTTSKAAKIFGEPVPETQNVPRGNQLTDQIINGSTQTITQQLFVPSARPLAQSVGVTRTRDPVIVSRPLQTADPIISSNNNHIGSNRPTPVPPQPSILPEGLVKAHSQPIRGGGLVRASTVRGTSGPPPVGPGLRPTTDLPPRPTSPQGEFQPVMRGGPFPPYPPNPNTNDQQNFRPSRGPPLDNQGPRGGPPRNGVPGQPFDPRGGSRGNFRGDGTRPSNFKPQQPGHMMSSPPALGSNLTAPRPMPSGQISFNPYASADQNPNQNPSQNPNQG